MRETFNFRVNEKHASLLFGKGEGKRLGINVRDISLDSKDPRVAEVGRLNKEIRSRDPEDWFFLGWGIARKYDNDEMQQARLLHLIVWEGFESSGEDHGTKYSGGCSVCGSGQIQLGPLKIPTGRISPSVDITSSLAGEIVLSERLADLLNRSGMSGFELQPVEGAERSRTKRTMRYQLKITSCLDLSSSTKFGDGPFSCSQPDEPAPCVCNMLLGLNLLSEAHVKEASWDGSDMADSRQYYGTHRGSLRPVPLLFCSPRMHKLFANNKIQGASFEVASLDKRIDL